MLLFYIVLGFIAATKVLSLNVSFGEIIGLELQFGTLTGDRYRFIGAPIVCATGTSTTSCPKMPRSTTVLHYRSPSDRARLSRGTNPNLEK